MASVNNAPRYDSKVACITDHAGKQHQLRTGLKDPKEAAIAANVLELLRLQWASGGDIYAGW